jgi:hypothetical protein
LEQRAHERGCSGVTTYVGRLITTDLLAAQFFDDILAPIRQTFHACGMSEDEAAALFAEAREEVYQERGCLVTEHGHNIYGKRSHILPVSKDH